MQHPHPGSPGSTVIALSSQLGEKNRVLGKGASPDPLSYGPVRAVHTAGTLATHPGTPGTRLSGEALKRLPWRPRVLDPSASSRVDASQP